MPNLHDIERRIGSVSSTKQITRTMEMVAAAKIRLAGERVAAATPYAESMVEMLANVAKRVGGSENALLRKHDEVKNVLIVVVVSDRGLAGGFNSNVLRQVDRLMKSRRPALRSASLPAARRPSAITRIAVSSRSLPSLASPPTLRSRKRTKSPRMRWMLTPTDRSTRSSWCTTTLRIRQSSSFARSC